MSQRRIKMGRDFRINETESTYKPVSYCMYHALELEGLIKHKEASGRVTVKEVAKVILGIESILGNEKLTDKVVKEFSFYDNETESDVREHLTEAKNKFTEALVWTVATSERYLTFSYL